MPNSLSRKKDYRDNLLRNQATSLILYEELKTTKAKAKAVKPVLEHLIQIAKKADAKSSLAARRRLKAELFDKNAIRKVFEVYVPRYKNLQSGFINSYHLGSRLGDSSEMVILRMVAPKTEELKPINNEDKSKDAPEVEKDNSKSKRANLKAKK